MLCTPADPPAGGRPPPQTWFSPLHVWHLMSLERAVRQILDFLLKSAATTATETAEEVADKAARKVARREEGLKEGRQCRRLMLSLGIAEVSVLWMVRRQQRG